MKLWRASSPGLEATEAPLTMRVPTYRWLQGFVMFACLSSPVPAAAQTYAEVLAECATLFTPLVSIAQARAMVPDMPLSDEPHVTGNLQGCMVSLLTPSCIRLYS
jgi:hypothetical protein